LHRACVHGSNKILKLLLDNGENPERPLPIENEPLPIHLAAANGNTETIRILLDRGASVNARDSMGSLALVDACQTGISHECARFLIESGAEIDAIAGNRTPMTMAAVEKKTKFVKLLLEKGADVNKLDKTGMTPLLLTCFSGTPEHIKIARLLLKYGADPNVVIPRWIIKNSDIVGRLVIENLNC